MIGVISYLPKDKKLRDVRRRNHEKQLKWLTKLFPNETINIVAQGYEDDDLFPYKTINYIRFAEGIGPTESRNILLKQFYRHSDDSYLFLSDDDVLSYPYYDADRLIYDIYRGKKVYDIDILLPMMPQHTPFKELNLRHEVEMYYNLVPSNANNCPNMMLYRRQSKERYYKQNVDLLHEDAIPEDSRFIVDAIADGLKVYKCECWIKNSLDIIKSVIFSTDESTNKQQHMVLVQNLTRYCQENYNSANLTTFVKQYSKAIPIRIRRDVEYILPENLKTITRRSSHRNKKLFSGE